MIPNRQDPDGLPRRRIPDHRMPAAGRCDELSVRTEGDIADVADRAAQWRTDRSASSSAPKAEAIRLRRDGVDRAVRIDGRSGRGAIDLRRVPERLCEPSCTSKVPDDHATVVAG